MLLTAARPAGCALPCATRCLAAGLAVLCATQLLTAARSAGLAVLRTTQPPAAACSTAGSCGAIAHGSLPGGGRGTLGGTLPASVLVLPVMEPTITMRLSAPSFFGSACGIRIQGLGVPRRQVAWRGRVAAAVLLRSSGQ